METQSVLHPVDKYWLHTVLCHLFAIIVQFHTQIWADILAFVTAKVKSALQSIYCIIIF